MLMDFPPTLVAAQARLQAVNPARYAKTRNALDGAVTELSPYFTHGLLDLPEALQTLAAQHELTPEHKLVMEFGWREFFAHAWQHLGAGIFSDQRPSTARLGVTATVPDDIRSASTGIPAIDEAVKTLYATGYLHNHARMWLASYLVHLRKLRWQAGADWLYGHLLDGDLASNHLSWQWVAGTFSIKPYLFNAENVARYAPPPWHSPGTVIDTSYEALAELAQGSADVGPEARRPSPVAEPALFAAPPEALTLKSLPDLAGKAVRLVHPWMLGDPPQDGALALGVVHLPFHARFPWSAARWQFVLTRLCHITNQVFVGDLHALAPQLVGATVTSRATANPGYAELLAAMVQRLQPIPRFLPQPTGFCRSYSRFYGTARGSLPAGRWHE